MPGNSHFTTAISRHIWDTKYRFRDGKLIHDSTIEDSWRRTADALASVEASRENEWSREFYRTLENFDFIPGGRILAGAGTSHRVTLFNCFVMGIIDDSMDGIFDALKEGALTLQQGGGVGYDFSTLRPRGASAKRVGTIASGPLSFMRIWDSMCATLLSTGARRGAMMATLRCDHPDIEDYIAAKQDKRELRHFNLSVLVTDEFMQAVHEDGPWPLVFPDHALLEMSDEHNETVIRRWSGVAGPIPCRVIKTVSARELWGKIMSATYDYAEPGVLFIDRINTENNLAYCEVISATNPCGEIPLPPYGACNLGSLNLVRFIDKPFCEDASFDYARLTSVVQTATRMLDNVIDLSRFPLEKQAAQARGSRRIGLGMTGLADAMIMLGLVYGSQASCEFSAKVMKTICDEAYRTSVELASEKGSFPFLDKEKYLQAKFVTTLPADIRGGIEKHGIRNSHLTAIAPTGTISLLANNVSSGLEPVFDLDYSRQVLELDGSYTEYQLSDYAYRLWQQQRGGETELPAQFVDVRSIVPQAHLEIQAAVQPYVDNAISKTINVPKDYPFADFRNLYQLAYQKGLKGCTTFRPNPITGAVLTAGKGFERASHCCDLERETD